MFRNEAGGNKAPREILDGAAKITVLKTKDGKDIPRSVKRQKKKNKKPTKKWEGQ